MKLTCGTCGNEIVGAYRMTGFDPYYYTPVWTSVPEIINAHDCETN